jgi:tRNA G10  N-methylase Trm11
LAYHHWDAIDAVIGSDVDDEALSLAERNLALLTIENVDRQVADISRMLASYHKSSHKAALESAKILRERLVKLTSTRQVNTHLFCADATDGRTLREGLQGRQVDIVITDVPYGRHSTWQDPTPTQKPDQGPPIWRVLEALRIVVSEHTVIAIAANKQQRISHKAYSRIEKFRVGKRQVVLLKPNHPRVRN